LVKRIVIAGGIGAGKTAVTDRLRSLGYDVIDADVVAHRITDGGQPALQALREAFGDAILQPDGSLDRPFLADVVFHDRSALRRLNQITHGHIALEISREMEAAHGAAVFVALPLFRPEHRDSFFLDEVWAVQVAPEVAVDRLVRLRGFSEPDARARLANQMTNDECAATVDRVIWNEGSLDDLYHRIDEALIETGVSGG
jgi:dephospho-CoA kinase